MGLLELSAAQALNAQLGQGGLKYIDQAGTANTGTASAGVYYVAVTVIEAGSIATESDDQNLWPDTTFASIPAGTTIYGRFNKVTVSGSNATAICYRG